MTTLCLDFGNTRLKYAVFAGDDMTHIDVLEQGSVEEVAAVLEKHRPDKSILNSVVGHDPALEGLLKDN